MTGGSALTGASAVAEEVPRRGIVRRVRHAAVRIAATVVLLAILIGVPVLLIGVLRLPLPDRGTWRAVVSGRRLDENVAVSLGALVFVALWAWFAASAAAECWSVVRWRRSGCSADPPQVSHGPTRWLRLLVRAAVLTGVSVGPALGPLEGPYVGAEVRVEVSAERVGSATAGRGDRWADMVQSAVTARDRDSDGRIRRPADAGGGDEVSALGLRTTREVLSAVMFAVGALALLDSARRRRLRAAPLGARAALPSIAQVRTEMMLRTLGDDERVMRLDVALRAVSPLLAEQGIAVVVAVVGRHGEIRLLPSAAGIPAPPWRQASEQGWWALPSTVTVDELSAASRSDAPPCPALVHLGTTDDGECFIDLEAVGVLEIVSQSDATIVDSISATLSTSPFLSADRVLNVGSSGSDVDVRTDGAPSAERSMSTRDDSVGSLDEAMEMAAVILGDTHSSIGDRSTFERRVTSRGCEAFEPVVVVARAIDAVEVDALRPLIRSGRGIGLVVARSADRAAGPMSGGAVLRRRIDSGWVLRDDRSGDGQHVLEPCGLRLRPAIVPRRALVDIRELLAAESEHLDVAAPVVSINAARGSTMAESSPFVEPDWELLVRVLGAVEVVAADGTVAQFERSKALELVVWLAMHRRRPTRGAARAALWDLDVRDATFANVVSEARRTLAKAAMPSAGEEWIPRTLTDALPLDERVMSDAELLELRVRHAAGLPHRDAIEVISPGLEMVTGMPFAGSSFLWCDAEGHASALVLLVVGAATRLAQHHLALGDVEGVFWATGRGLLVLSGHEELIALRMRAHASAGDLAGVRDEWERYERALQADPWSAAAPSPKLASLRRELLGRTG